MPQITVNVWKQQMVVKEFCLGCFFVFLHSDSYSVIMKMSDLFFSMIILHGDEWLLNPAINY